MGFKEEYRLGRDWIEQHLNLNINTDLSAFETNIRFVGGLLSMYTLSDDKMFLRKAEEVATLLLPIFDTPSGIPHALVNPRTKQTKNFGWASGGCSILAEFGTLSLEFQYLSDLTGNLIFAQKIKKIYEVLNDASKEDGLYFNYMNPSSAKWCMKHASIGALADSFYEYMLKYWLYLAKSDDAHLAAYLTSMKAIRSKMVRVSPKEKLTYIAEWKSSRLEHKMDHLACFTGGLFGLTSVYVDTLPADEKEIYLSLAKEVTNTCHESYTRTETKLGPEAFHFERADSEARSLKSNERYYILRPETVESYFYLWRFTKDEKYRDWAWEYVQALEKHCRTPNGYTGIRDVYEKNGGGQDDVQQSFFFAETLKYLFLIYSEDSVLPLDKYVFNTEAHPFLIKSPQSKL